MTWTPRHTLILTALVGGGYGLLVWYIIWGLHGAYSIQGTRLLLVLTLTIAMFGFGGLLIFTALTAEKGDDKFADRFRLAREIFLVFSGIFGTIIGFYFGIQDEPAGAGADQLQVEVSWANGKAAASMSGGAGPFTGILTPNQNGPGEVQTTDSRVLTFTMKDCSPDATIIVVDGRGHRAETSVKCETSGPSGTGETNAADNGTATNQSGGNTTGNNTAANGH